MLLKRPLISIAVLNEVAPPENRKDLNRLAALKKADVVTGYNFYSGQEAALRGIFGAGERYLFIYLLESRTKPFWCAVGKPLINHLDTWAKTELQNLMK